MDAIYLDHNSTAPVLPEVAAAMQPWLAERYGNPASQHSYGRRARAALEEAREAVGRMLGANPSARESDRVVFTSGGTEANNLALFGLARVLSADHVPGEAIVSSIEHASVSACADLLAEHGWKVHRLPVGRDGVVDLAALDLLLNERTRFVSVMLANNETGVIQPVAEISRRCRALDVPMHTDAVQVAGKLPVDFQALGVDLLSVAAHKFHGPLGTGALVVRSGVEIEPLLRGGFHQGGLRPGTESVALAVGMQAALDAFAAEGTARTERLQTLRDRLENGLRLVHPNLVVNGAAAPRLPHTSSIALVGFERQALWMALDQACVACTTGSACASGSSQPSTVLRAMGCPGEVLDSSLRFSLGATTTTDEVDEAVRRIGAVLTRLAGTRSDHGPRARARSAPAKS